MPKIQNEEARGEVWTLEIKKAKVKFKCLKSEMKTSKEKSECMKSENEDSKGKV